jgi:hypothetical protein
VDSGNSAPEILEYSWRPGAGGRCLVCGSVGAQFARTFPHTLKEGGMTILETIGMAWIIFTSALSTIGIIYLSFIGLKSVMIREPRDPEMPVEVKEMFKIAR